LFAETNYIEVKYAPRVKDEQCIQSSDVIFVILYSANAAYETI